MFRAYCELEKLLNICKIKAFYNLSKVNLILLSIDTDHTCYTMTTAGSEGFLTLIPIYLDHILYPTLTVSSLIYKSLLRPRIYVLKKLFLFPTLMNTIRSIGKIKFLDRPLTIHKLLFQWKCARNPWWFMNMHSHVFQQMAKNAIGWKKWNSWCQWLVGTV